jgi:hypothetical protein
VSERIITSYFISTVKLLGAVTEVGGVEVVFSMSPNIKSTPGKRPCSPLHASDPDDAGTDGYADTLGDLRVYTDLK